MKIDTLMGKNLYLEPMKEKTYSFLVNWLSDSNIIKFLDDSECHLTLEEVKKIYPIDNIDKNILFTIIEKNSNQIIGICGLQKIDIDKKNAFLRIIIGNVNFWDGKTALESEKLLLKFAFSELKLNKVYSVINEKNTGQAMLVERLGMKKDGISRNHFIQNGKYFDANLYSILSKEFIDS
jgi:RimJ/RimL family protein N-acetyltransferase